MSKYVFVKINDDITSIKRLKEMFPKIDEDDFKTILESDPTYNNNAYEAGKYGRWLLSLFNKNNLKKEDLYKAKEYLEKFDKLKNKISNKDINTYKNLPDLYKAIEETESKSPTKSELKRNVQRTDLDKDAELYMETENFKIYIPLTYEASCKLGANTEWCTATRSDRGYYDRYTSGDEKLYIFINKKDPSEKYQWNTKQRYTCDRKDEEIAEIDLCIKYPDLANFFDKFGYNIKKTMKEIEEYKEGKEYIYEGELIEGNIAPYLKKIKVSTHRLHLTEIGVQAFTDCKSLESIEIPNGITRIGDYAFEGCKSLKNITIPNSMEIIGCEAFAGCKSLTSIEIPDSVISIKRYAFAGCWSLKNIKIPNSVTKIEDCTFFDCRSLTSITIPGNVKRIGDNVFEDCKLLTSVTISDGVESMGDYVFKGCDSLKSIEVPDSVTRIELYTFEGCNPDVVIKSKNLYVLTCNAINELL